MKSLKEYAGFKIGDVVQIKSGGPGMTIDYITDWGEDGGMEIHCIWFFTKSSNDEIVKEQGNFPPVALKKIESDQ